MNRYGIGHSIGHVFCFFVMAVLLGWNARTLGQRAIVTAAILSFAAATEACCKCNSDLTMRFEWKTFASDALGMVLGLATAGSRSKGDVYLKMKFRPAPCLPLNRRSPSLG